MEEKLSALEMLGVCKGFSTINQWHVHSNTSKTKRNIPDIQKSVSSEIILNNVNNLPEKGAHSKINATLQNHFKTEIKEREETVIDCKIFKTCREMEFVESENDIPDNCISVMNAICDRNKKTENYDNIEFNKISEVPLDEKNGETSNEESNLDDIKTNVQEWINHLPIKDNSNCSEEKDNSQKPDEDSLVRAQLSREASLQSSSSLDSILDSRRPDPVEIFLNLGFGGLPGIDTENCRIPKRFLVPSKCKGGDWNEFLRRELIQAQNFECSSLGFRGLSGPSYRRPSAIVANIMEKLRENAVPQTHNRSRFSTVAKMVLNEKSVLNKLTPESQSVLSPDSRKFLQNQGKKSPEVPRRRIIFGQKSFAFAHDGEFVELETLNVDDKKTKDASPQLSPTTEKEPISYPNPEVMLKLRRSSLQKQKNVDEDVEDVFFVVGNKDRSTESLYANITDNKSNSNNNNNSNNDNDSSSNKERSNKAGKIPRRFLSSGNLKALEDNLSESMRWEVEKEILSLSRKIKSISSQDLPSVWQQVKELRSKIENSSQDSNEV